MILHEDRYKKCVDAINKAAASKRKYTFDEFCTEKHLYSETDRERVGGRFICCPFHHENKPSLLIEEEKRSFKCFGCGVHGDYVQFVTMYDRMRLGKSLSREQKVNELLKADPFLQSEVGANSIFSRDTYKLENVKPLTFNKFKIGQQAPKSFLELAEQMQRAHCTVAEIKYAVILMQGGMMPNVIAQNLDCLSCKGDSITFSGKYSIDKLNEEE